MTVHMFDMNEGIQANILLAIILLYFGINYI